MFTTTPIQKRFRFVNEEIFRQSEPASQFRSLDFICECRDPSCFSVLPLTVSRFARITAISSSYAVLSGHPTSEVAAGESSRAA